MIKLVIENCLEGDCLYDYFYDPNTKSFVRKRIIEQYDEKKWKNGSIYEFNTLREIGEFIETCSIDFTEEYASTKFNEWYWEEIDINYFIDKTEDNLIILVISSHSEFRE